MRESYSAQRYGVMPCQYLVHRLHRHARVNEPRGLGMSCCYHRCTCAQIAAPPPVAPADRQQASMPTGTGSSGTASHLQHVFPPRQCRGDQGIANEGRQLSCTHTHTIHITVQSVVTATQESLGKGRPPTHASCWGPVPPARIWAPAAASGMCRQRPEA